LRAAAQKYLPNNRIFFQNRHKQKLLDRSNVILKFRHAYIAHIRWWIPNDLFAEFALIWTLILKSRKSPKRSRESLRRCSIETSLAIVSLIGNNIYTYLKSLRRGLRKAAVTRTRSLTREIYISDIKYGVGTIKGHYGDLPRQSKVKWLSYSIAINPIPPCKITIRDLYSLVPRKSGAIRHIPSVFRLSFLLSTRDRVVNARVHICEKKYAKKNISIWCTVCKIGGIFFRIICMSRKGKLQAMSWSNYVYVRSITSSILAATRYLRRVFAILDDTIPFPACDSLNFFMMREAFSFFFIFENYEARLLYIAES